MVAVFSETTIKRLFALSGNNCGYPGCPVPIVEKTGIVTGEICHIKARSPGGPRFDPNQSSEERNAFENLILLCRNHHKVVDADPNLYTVDALLDIKAIHGNVAGRPEQESDRFFAKILINDAHRVTVTNNSGNVAVNSPGAIQGRNITVKTTRSKVSVNAPPGTIGADQQASRYVQHLIRRYNEFAGSDSTRKAAFSYGAISRNIASNFGSDWRLLPLEKATAVFAYLQERISKTRQAKINKGKGKPSFSSYDEFLSKHEF